MANARVYPASSVLLYLSRVAILGGNLAMTSAAGEAQLAAAQPGILGATEQPGRLGATERPGRLDATEQPARPGADPAPPTHKPVTERKRFESRQATRLNRAVGLYFGLLA
jgi:hypothetical protein